MKSGARPAPIALAVMLSAASFSLGGCTSNAVQIIDIGGFAFAGGPDAAEGTTADTEVSLAGFTVAETGSATVEPAEPAEAVDGVVDDATDAVADSGGPDADPAAGPAVATVATASEDETDVSEVRIAPDPPEAVEAPARKKGFLAAFWSNIPRAEVPAASDEKAPVATSAKGGRVTIARATVEKREPLARTFRLEGAGEALPGVRTEGLFDISRKSGLDDDSDVDLNENDGSYRVASAAGLARLAPNGLLTQREGVDVSCLKPGLVRMLKAAERHYGRRVMVTSGYRSPGHNKRVRGARNSMHMYCAAADVQIDGVAKWELARYFRSLPGRGGVGTYCHTNSVHVDVGPERDWNWRCRRRKAS